MDAFAEAFRKTINKWFGPDPKQSKDYARIVSTRHVDRIMSMLNNRKSGAIAVGGDYDREERYIAPTLVTDVKFDDEVLMGDEIFGPILPVIPYKNLDDAIHMINKKWVETLEAYVWESLNSIFVIQPPSSRAVCLHQQEEARPKK